MHFESYSHKLMNSLIIYVTYFKYKLLIQLNVKWWFIFNLRDSTIKDLFSKRWFFLSLAPPGGRFVFFCFKVEKPEPAGSPHPLASLFRTAAPKPRTLDIQRQECPLLPAS